MNVVVQLRSDIARELNAQQSLASAASDHPELRSLANTLEQFHVDLVPQHPSTPDAALQSWFTVSCASAEREQCEAIAAALRTQPAVLAAYLKPDAEPAQPGVA